MGLLKKLFFSAVVSILVAVMITGALQDRIFFSAFLGIPAGIITFIVVFRYLSSKEMNAQS